MNKKGLVLLGAGGHAKVVLEALRSARLDAVACLDANPALRGLDVGGVPIKGGDDKASEFPPEDYGLVNGIGAIKDTAARRALYEAFVAKKYVFGCVAAASAVVASSAKLGRGCQVLTRAVVHPNAAIGENAVVNTGAIVEHDVDVGAHAFLGPGAILCGEATVGAGAFIGAGAIVLPGVKIGVGSLVGAGALVRKDVPPGGRAVGL